tara:strand:- start:64 stop:291 length:228 start_codon:yes stop_codon:yes gene_type:complete
MEKSKLSFYYHLACDRVHIVLDDLYESLHDDDGDPIMDPALIESSIQAASSVINEELSIIKTALDEHSEGREVKA